MANKRYVDVVQRALDEEIAQLQRQQAPTAPQQAQSASPPLPTFGAAAPDTQDRFRGPPTGAPLPPSAPAPGYGGAPPAAKQAARPTQAEMVAGLDQRVTRLIQVRDWISEDGDIARLIDSVIGRQIRASEQRQARFGVFLNAVFLIAGWALSLVGTPAALAGLLHH